MNIVRTQPKSNARISLIIASILYLLIAVAGTLIAIRENLPSRTFIPAFITGKPALADFLTGNGTALSPPLYLCLVEAVLVVLACLPNRSAMVGIVGLTILGTIYLFGILIERLTYRVLNPATFDFSLVLVELFAIILPLLMIIFGGMEMARLSASSS